MPYLVAWTARTPAHQVTDTDVVTLPKADAVIMTKCPGNARVAILITIVHVGRPMIVKVLASTLDPVMKATPLGIVVLLRRSVPATRTLLVALRRWPWRRPILRMREAAAIQKQGKQRCGREPTESVHLVSFLKRHAL